MVDDALLCKGCDLVWLMPGVLYTQAMELVGVPKSEASGDIAKNLFK